MLAQAFNLQYVFLLPSKSILIPSCLDLLQYLDELGMNECYFLNY